MEVYRVLLYNNPNIGLYARADSELLLLPNGFPAEKGRRLAELMGCSLLNMSIAGTRLLGPLLVMNRHGVLVSWMADEDELMILRDAMPGRVVERLRSRVTAVGNLLAVNDRGAVASDLLGPSEISQVEDVLDVHAERMTVAGFHQVGAVIAANNSGALIHPLASDEELSRISGALKVEDVDRGTLNGGVPFVSSGIVVNDRSALVGSKTTGPELFIVSKVFKGG
ncbi:translation initiation factor IF-6 [Conexivisphaera calida]|uniref:Translation initiation factor 6 n=1 Tax=Conexivisphaera calida TaxID=1874277 RepID=A0A4P2VPY0_9ARCH|nr:translation initiation factor IF-6 [Conexivisphaera calida]BBE42968.1 Eukaryotic translation initiation factor 6 [Conexivisphaera calida]